MTVHNQLQIKSIISDKQIITHFQPLISIRKKSVLGVEALSRSIYENEIIPPDILFKAAAKENLTVELDRLCREKAFENFARSFPTGEDQLLFLILIPVY
ncbi:hypothetical protein N752_25780 [Desulforamulus aquiferis]|nr:EAL domain-containing protein [Desulforamulus aquiferis]RYD02225.1 hypothetical protein N752_25780 [Desulforamulus aquiferis]